MSETASLVIAVDSTDADRAVKSLRDLAQQGKVTESSLKQTGDSSRNLKRVSNEAESAARSMGLLESAAKGVVAALSIREIVGAVDGYTQLTAQIKLVTNSTQEYARAYQSVRDIARTTQADLSSTAMLYARIANATKELGVSQQTVADITEAVNLSLRVSGASAAEASSAMLQLSQAFAGGVLRGEEFNAVIESSPRLIQALAEGMGVTVGQMRSLAADGKITAEVMANVLPQALGKLRDEAQHVQTISGAFQNLKNEVLELIGTQAEATGFTTAVSAGLNLLANNLTTVVTIAGMLATARVAGAIAGITKEILGLGSAAAVARRGMGLLGGGFGLLAGVLAGGVMAWMSYRESVNATRKALTDVNAPIDDLIKKFKELSTLEQQAAIRGLAEAAKDAEKELAEAFESLAKVPGRLRAHPAFKEFRQEIERIKDADLGVDELDKQVASLVGSFKEATPQAQKAHEAVERLGNAVINAAKKNEKLAQTQKAVAEITDTVADSLDRAAIAAARAAAGLNTKEWDTFIQKAEAAATTVGMTAQQLGEFQARAMGASEAQAQLAGVLYGMADTARQLEKATADKDFKAIKGAQDTLTALAQQEVQLRVNIRQAEAYAALLAMGLSQASALQGSQTEAELEGLRAMEEVLQRIQNLRDNIENSTKPSKSATSAAEKATKAINDQIKALQLQAATVGMAEDQVTLYKLATEGATKAQLASAKAALDARRAGELSLAVAKRRIDTSNDAIKAAAEEAQRNIDLAETFGLSAAGIEQLTVARLEHELARAEAAGADADEIERLKILIALRQESMGALITLEQKEAEKAAWESWSRDVEQIFQQVGQSLTDALFEGGRSARDLIKDLFKTLTLRVLIQPVMGGLQGLFMGAGPAGIANAGSAAGMMGSPTSLFNMFGGNSMGMGMSNVMSHLSTSSMLQGTGAGNWLMGQAGNVAGMSNLALGGAGLLGGLGANLIFGGKGHSGIGGGLGSTLGMALGGPLGAVAGTLIGGGLGSLFGDREPTTRREQRTQVEYAGGIFDVTKVDDRAPAGADAAARALAEQAVATANDIFRQVGVDAAIDSFHAIMASSYKGDRDGVASGGRLRIGDEYRQFGIANEGNPTIQGFGGWSSADTLPRLATDIQLSVLEAFQSVGDQLPSVLATMLADVDVRSLGEAEAQALAERFTALTQGAAAFLSTLEQTPFAELRDLSFDAAAGMVQFAGGLDNLLTAQQTYYERFYSEQEKFEHSVDLIGKALSEVGLEMPALVGSTDDMLASYRALVESLDLNTEAGQQAYVMLMQTAGAFADVAEFAGQAAGASRSAADIAKERYNLETQLLQLMGDTDALRARELAAIHESNRALQEHIWAMQDQAAAAQAASAAFQSAASQLQRSMQMVKTGGALADKLGGMLGLDPVFGPMREQELWAAIGSASYEQQIEMAGELTDIVLNRINAEQKANQQRLTQIREELTNYRRMRDIGASLQTYLGSLESSNLAPYSLAEKVSNAEAELNKLVSAARRGDENAMRQVQGALQNALSLWREYGASGQEYQDAYHRLTKMVGNLASGATSEAARQIAQLEAQSAALESMSGISAESLAQLQQLYDITVAATMAAQAQYETDLANANTELAQLEKMSLDTARLHEIADVLKGMPALIGAQLAGASAAREQQYYQDKLAQLQATGSTTGGIDWRSASTSDLAAYFESVGLTPGQHYNEYGKYEGLSYGGDTRDQRYYEAKLAQLQATGSTTGGIDWRSATIFDLAAYFRSLGLTPEEHYQRYGKYEGLSYAVGTSYVPRDMTANIHKGEIIIDPRSSDILRRYGIEVQSSGGDAAEMKALRQEVARLAQVVEQVGQAQVTATHQAAERSADKITSGVTQAVTRRDRDDLNKRKFTRTGTGAFA